MQSLRGGLLIVTGTLLALRGSAGCSSEETVGNRNKGPIEVFTYWTAAGEIQALDAALLVYKEKYQSEVTKTAVQGTTSDRDELLTRIESGAPPDVIQANGGISLCTWVTSSQEYVENLDAFAEANKWTDPNIMPQPAQDAVRCPGPDGAKHFYGVPINIHRANTLFYNRRLFAEVGIAEPPASIEEFFAIAEAIKQAKPDVAPLALGTTAMKGGPWPLSMVIFGCILPGMHGVGWYKKFYAGQADLSSTTTEDATKLRAVLDAGARILDHVNPNFQDIGWDEAAEMLHTNTAAMYVGGDWVNGTYLGEGWSATDDFGGRAAFGDAFIMNADAFAVPLGARNRAGAMDFLTVMASAAGLNAFNRIKGSIPPRIGQLDLTYNEYAQGAAADFSTAGDRLLLQAMTPGIGAFQSDVLEKLRPFQTDKNVDNLMLAVRNAYGNLTQQSASP